MTTTPVDASLPHVDDLVAIVEQVVVSILDAEPLIGPAGPALSEPVCCAWVTVAGEVPMLVAAATSLLDATSMAKQVLEVAEPASDDVDDALGELANVIGGNVKSLLPEGSTLSLPQVAAGSVPLPALATPHQRLQAAWGPHKLQVATWLLPTDQTVPTRRTAP